MMGIFFFVLQTTLHLYLLYPAEAERTDCLAFVASKAEGTIFNSANDLEPFFAGLFEPASQLRLGPVAACHQEDATLSNKG
jgi:ABC-type cobalt transport system substrate-binding protein